MLETYKDMTYEFNNPKYLALDTEVVYVQQFLVFTTIIATEADNLVPIQDDVTSSINLKIQTGSEIQLAPTAWIYA